MRILGIDPGTERSAWVLWDTTAQRIVAKGINENGHIGATHRAPGLAVDLVVIEMIASYGMPVGREVFETVVWIGRFVERFSSSPVVRIVRGEVKSFWCHSGKANDATIRAAILDRFGPGREKAVGTKKAPGPLYGVVNDEWAALALVIAAAETQHEAVS